MKLSEEVIASETVNDFGVSKRRYQYVGDDLISDRIAALEQELSQCLTVHAKLNDKCERVKEELAETGEKVRLLDNECDRLTEAVRMFVEEMKSQFPNIMLPGEFDTMAELVTPTPSEPGNTSTKT